MIRNETFRDGICIRAEIIDLDAGVYTLEVDGEIVESHPLTADEICRYGPQPLDSLGAAVTLLAVVGAVTVEDAANAVGQPPEALVAEAEAWAAAQQQA
jgi:hypothetical protein